MKDEHWYSLNYKNNHCRLHTSVYILPYLIPSGQLRHSSQRLNQPGAYLIIASPDNYIVNGVLCKNDISKILFYKLKMADTVIPVLFLE